MKTFFTSDHHFGHKNIIEYSQRPFANVEEMDEYMIEVWNRMVEPDDTVYHLGDFTLGNGATAIKYFEQLNGQIKILTNIWHHDKRWIKYLQNKWHKLWMHIEPLPPMVVLENKPPIVLCHYPIARWDRKHYGSWHLHGHSHGEYLGKGFIMDVGVDANNFTPVSMETVKEYMNEISE